MNENPELDTLIPFSRQLRTNHLILRGEYEKISLAIYGKLISAEEASLIVSRQFEVSQPMRREDNISPLLSEEEEEMLAKAAESLSKIEEAPSESMADIKLAKEVNSVEGGFAEKLGVLAEALFTSMNSSPSPSAYTAQLKDFTSTIEAVISPHS